MARRFELVAAEHASRVERAWRDLLKTEGGRHLLANILDMCGINSSTYSQDAAHSAFLEGRRSIGLELQALCLAPQGAAVHGQLLIEAERRAQELQVAYRSDEESEDEYDGA